MGKSCRTCRFGASVIASEGALAFKEIARIPSISYHLLDVRHGPMVLIDDKTW